MTNQHTYSIIIPHHNTPDLLQRCLDSIPERENIQVIVVDDNSSEEKVDFAHFPGMERHNVQTILSKAVGRGAGYARNQALPLADGEWVLFADADDYFLPEAFTSLDSHRESTGDLIVFAMLSRFSDTGEPSNRQNHLMPLLENYDASNEDSVNLLRYKFFEPWCKMIRRSLIEKHNIRFEEVMWANDVWFSTMVGHYAQKMEVDLTPIYCVTVTPGSLVNQRNEKSRCCRYEVMLRVNQWLRSVGKPQYQHSLMYSLRRIATFGPRTFIRMIRLGRTYDAQFMHGWQDWIKNAWYSIAHNEDKDKQKYIIQ